MQGSQVIRIVEVEPRDGLQNETTPVPTETKVAFVDALSGTGVDEIEVSAFVSPRRGPRATSPRRPSLKPSRERGRL
jgi:hydroxymethylglutaryl-CoA lyase